MKRRKLRCWLATSTLLCSLTSAGLAGAVPDTAAGDPRAEPSAEAEAEDNPALRALREAAAKRLDGSAKDALQNMSDQELGQLMNSPDDAQLSEEQQAVMTAVAQEAFESQLNYQTGDIVIGDGLATLHLDGAFRYLDPTDSQKILVEAWGNPPGSETLGMIFPVDVSPLDIKRGWGVVVTYSEDGHVDDDDAEDIDYDELLEQMQEDTSAANEARIAQGYEALTLVGWAAPPHYDAATHRLYWAQELSSVGASENTLNYAIRVLGRKGVLELNAVAGMSQLNDVKVEMEKVLPRADFEAGSRYEDFDPDIDEVAAYGIGGLIAGKALMKVGFFAGLLKLLLAGKKLVIFGVLGVGAFLAKLFKGRGASSD